ncbi:MAG: hypothetical protein Q8P02_00575, partial [Candidatus Micrarchaeota archaeon]|nr:hypothetical protein [Candidatus Micrarchaeota archaeon]
YHNRIVSLIEIYRTDLASVFRESLRRNIEEFILRPGWLTFRITNTNERGEALDAREVRLNRCQRIKEVAVEMVCSVGAASGTVSGSTQANLVKTFDYGIPGWVAVASEKFSFEGITFEPANPEQMKLLNPDKTDPAQLNEYYNKCRELVKPQSNLFDCQTFATTPGKYQCVDENRNVVPGCETGIFYLNVTPQESPAVYQALPRITGDDGFGNRVISGAIGEESFLLPINIRIFQYDDLALEFFRRLAFNDGANKGIADLICIGDASYCQPKGGRNPPIGSGLAQTTPNGRRTVIQQLVNALQGGFSQARQSLQANRPLADRTHENFRLLLDKIDTDTCLDESQLDGFRPACRDVLGAGNLLQEAVNAQVLEPTANLEADATGVQKHVGHYGETTFNFFIIDSNP